ncbi:MAG: NTP transferase domain-containing protein [Gemmatimonadetes bacterium]|nr:NTP transferase domain-containing protein [Gemmatimonadota bacterium]
MSERVAVVLAAGEGTRMRSSLPKVLHELHGRPLIGWVLAAIEAAGYDRTVVIIGHKGELVKRAIEDHDVEIAWQREQLGTGHAVLQAQKALRGSSGQVTVLSGDVPLVRPETLAELVRVHKGAGAGATIMTAEFEDPTGYGRIVRGDDGMVERIVEQKDATEQEKKIREINSGTYTFEIEPLFDILPALGNTNASGEYYLTDVVAELRARGEAVVPFVVPDVWEIFGINTPEHLALASAHIEER